MHSLNGNRQTSKGLNIIQLNKGNSFFEKKVNSIQRIINDDRPDIICISESNIKYSSNDICNHFPGFNHELNVMSETIDISRNSILIKSSLNYKRRYDLEDKNTCEIWVEITIGKSNKILLMGGYRTWSALKCQNIENSRSNKAQLDRFNITLKNWGKAMDECKDVIVCMDDNVDSSCNNRHNRRYDITNIYNILQDFINKYSITQCNHNYTRVTSHQQPSCIDKIYTNRPTKMTNIQTKDNIDSDHKYVLGRYMTNEQTYRPKFILKRDYKDLTTYNINDYIDRSEYLNQIFTTQDTDFIAETIQMELNSIYNALAPGKLVQYRHDYLPYYNNEIKDEIKRCNDILTQAIKNNDPNYWREFRNKKNLLNKEIKNLKSKYLKSKLTQKNNNWKFLKQYNKQEKCSPPMSIVINGNNMTSPKEIANISNNYFIQKIEKIRNEFFNDIVSPMEIVNKLIPRVEENLDIPLISIKQTIQLINNTKNSNSTGHDDINNKFLKKCKIKIAPHITHLINSILITKNFSKIYKISKILPLSKPDLDKNLISSYRPINNLCCVEKLIEAHLLNNLENFFVKHNVINKNHHGARKHHSTVSAIAKIYDIIYKNDDNNLISVILTTDLSSAYDTIDIEILLKKLEHYGVRNQWTDLFKSYYSDRQQYVKLEHMNSVLRNAPYCSVVQGSKLSGLMFNLYCNEVPILHKLINTDIYHKLVSKNPLNIKNIAHNIINFVDDSTNVISFRDHNKIKPYLENYYDLLMRYYNINKMKINNDKNKLLIINKPKLDNVLKNFHFFAKDEIVRAQFKIKILGTWIQNDMRMDADINKLLSILHNRINNIRKINKYTDFHSRLNFINGFVMGKMNYMIPMYNKLPDYLHRKLHKITMTAARAAIGNYCYRKSTSYILDKCKWLHIDNLIKFRCISYIYKIQYDKSPKSIVEVYRENRFQRHKSEITINYVPKNTKYTRFFLYDHIGSYNQIPMEIKSKHPKLFKKYLKVWINQRHKDTMD